LEQLRADNPALRPAVWEGNKRIPVNFPLWVRREAVNSGDLLALVPEDFKFSMQTPDIAYVVERGDSLSVIARRFDTSVSRLAALNQLSNRHRIQIGQRLLLPQDSFDDQQLASNVKPSAPSDGVYTVRRGDTVSLIAARYGITEQSLLGNNGIQDRDRIYPGQQLTLPGFEPEHDQFVVIESSLTPTLPSREQVAGEIDEAVVLIDEVSVGDVENTVQETREEPPVQLALNEELLPPAAVLPDNQVLDTTVTPEEEQAVAIDPALDLAESNEQLTEALAADPSDYTVASNNTVEIHASETLGHYADWLGIRAWDIRRLNNMAFRDPVIIGKRLKLDFSRVNIAEFELKRRDFHSSLQQEFFSSYRIQDVEQYRVTSGDNIGRIARNRYSTPIWLLRQYNPELDFNRIQIGQVMVFPLLEQVN
jgi:membrane-bound lytic murein transglycosylase D